jgi:hypothetical protein
MRTKPTSLLPLRWVGSDFGRASGRPLLMSKVLHVLLCEGEMPWRTALRAALEQLRHRGSDAVTIELARVRVRDALGRWLPGIELRRVEVVSSGATLTLRLHVREGGELAAVDLEVS